MEESFFDKVYEIVKQIPKGKVSTYGQIASVLGMNRGARTVGFALAACKDENVPCHRVVDRFGRTKSAFDTYSTNVQRSMLEAEGVEFSEDNTIDLGKYLWCEIGKQDD
ncbi:MAG: methylated-DNA--[Clostridia bacterium]|nr:methylated-DNA--[protein]-cysteine S-methyltransferase [Clostridia bacterium]